MQLCGWLGMQSALRLRTAAILEEGGGGEKWGGGRASSVRRDSKEE